MSRYDREPDDRDGGSSSYRRDDDFADDRRRSYDDQPRSSDRDRSRRSSSGRDSGNRGDDRDHRSSRRDEHYEDDARYDRERRSSHRDERAPRSSGHDEADRYGRASSSRFDERYDRDRRGDRDDPWAARWDDDLSGNGHSSFTREEFGIRPDDGLSDEFEAYERRPSRRSSGRGGFVDRFQESVMLASVKAQAYVKSHIGGPAAKFIRKHFNKKTADWLIEQKRWRLVLTAVILIGCVAPSTLISIAAYAQLSQVKNYATAGLAELTAIQTFASNITPVVDPSATPTPVPTSVSGGSTPASTGPSLQDKAKALLAPNAIALMSGHCSAAQADFQKASDMVSGGGGVIGLASYSPLSGIVRSVQQLMLTAIDATELCQDLLNIAPNLAPIFSTGSLFASDGDPIFSAQTFSVLTQIVTEVQQKMVSINNHMSLVNADGLPLNSKQLSQIRTLKKDVPKALAVLTGLVPSMPMLKWAMGIDKPRNFLIQTMDRGELRPSGGFTGSFGVLNINGGRLGKISLTDVLQFDVGSGNPFRDDPPEEYRSWWVYGDWGLRDANLSGDFPTTAKIAMEQYTRQNVYGYYGPDVSLDGSISFSPLAIEHLLSPDIMGPIVVPCYNVEVTQDNLEDKIHLFQLGGGPPPKEDNCNSPTSNTSERKQFTAALASELQARVRTASPGEIFKIAESLHSDMLNKDVEIYFADQDAEAQLQSNGLGATIVTDPKKDATTIIQANVGANKGSIYVDTKFHDEITLDNTGGAKHTLTMTLDFKPPDLTKLYGWATFRDYIRVYVPENAQYIGGGGFDQGPGSVLCDYNVDAGDLCPPKGAPVCAVTADNPSGDYIPGYIPPSLEGRMGSGEYMPSVDQSLWSQYQGIPGTGHMDDLGEPTQIEQNEDLPGRSMFGGLVIIPPNCTATVTLQWYVPKIAGSAYNYEFQRQSGTFPNVEIDVTPASGTDIKSLHTTVSKMSRDQTWNLGS